MTGDPAEGRAEAGGAGASGRAGLPGESRGARGRKCPSETFPSGCSGTVGPAE